MHRGGSTVNARWTTNDGTAAERNTHVVRIMGDYHSLAALRLAAEERFVGRIASAEQQRLLREAGQRQPGLAAPVDYAGRGSRVAALFVASPDDETERMWCGRSRSTAERRRPCPRPPSTRSPPNTCWQPSVTCGWPRRTCPAHPRSVGRTRRRGRHAAPGRAAHRAGRPLMDGQSGQPRPEVRQPGGPGGLGCWPVPPGTRPRGAPRRPPIDTEGAKGVP
jgi:hypothetical protein